MKCWLTRDCYGLCLHYEYPTPDKKWMYYSRMQLEDTDFPEVTFENSPMEVELKLIEK